MAKVTLGEVSIESRETCKGDKSSFPAVGLEHITPEEIRLSHWDNGSDNTFTKRFHEGDILFGRRRAYLKKAAIAPFEGICSGDITVIRAIPDKIEPRLLPLIIQNDDFFDYAVGRSAGSLSPRVKWEHLKNYEFDLPEMNKQHELADVLWSIEDTRTAYQELATATEELVKSRFIEMFGDLTTSDTDKNCFSLQDLLDKKWITYHLDGNHGGDYPRSHEFIPDGVPYISANCIVNDKIDFSRGKYVSEERAARFRKGVARDQDVLFAHNATVGPVVVLKTDYPKVILGTSLTSYRCDENHIVPEYLKAYMEQPVFIQQYEADMRQSTRNQVPITKQRKYFFIIPTLEQQKEFSAFVQLADKSKSVLQQSIDNIQKLKAALIREYLI